MIRFGWATLVFVLVGTVGQVLARLFDETFQRALGGTGTMVYGGVLFLLLLGTWLLYLVVVYADIQQQDDGSNAWLIVVFLLGPLGAILYAATVHESDEGVEPSTGMRKVAAYWFRLWPPGVAIILAAVVAVFLVSPGILKTPCHEIKTVSGPDILAGFDTDGRDYNPYSRDRVFNRLRLHTDTPVVMVNVSDGDGEELYGQVLDEPGTSITVSSLAAGVQCGTFSVRLETADGRVSTAEMTGRLEEDYSYRRMPLPGETYGGY